MYDIKILDNIIPFNDLFFKSCFYNALFSVVIHFNRDIIPFLTNEFVTYGYKEKNFGIEFSINYNQRKDWHLVLQELGVGYECKMECTELTDSLIKSIDLNKPAIVCIDCFYELIRPDTFNKIHIPHSILVYGYNKQDKEFYIVEQKNVDTLSYRKCLISFDGIVKSNRGFIENFTGNGQYINVNNVIGNGINPTYFEYYCINKPTYFYDEKKYLYDMFDLMISNQGNITTSTEIIKNFIGGIKKIFNEIGIDKYVNQLISFINDVVHAKQVELYTLRVLSKDNVPVIYLKTHTIEEWKKIRVKIVKYLYTSTIGKCEENDIINSLLKIYTYESQYYEEVYNELYKYQKVII